MPTGLHAKVVIPHLNYVLSYTALAVSVLYGNFEEFEGPDNFLDGDPFRFVEKNAMSLYTSSRIRFDLLVDNMEEYIECKETIALPSTTLNSENENSLLVRCLHMNLKEKERTKSVVIEEINLKKFNNIDNTKKQNNNNYGKDKDKDKDDQNLLNKIIIRRGGKENTKILVFEHIYKEYQGKYDFIIYLDVDVHLLKPLAILKKVELLKESFSVFATEMHSRMYEGEKDGSSMNSGFIIARPECFKDVNHDDYSNYVNNFLSRQLNKLSQNAKGDSDRDREKSTDRNILASSLANLKSNSSHPNILKKRLCCVDEQSYIHYVLRRNCPNIYYMDYFDHCRPPLPIDYKMCNAVHRREYKNATAELINSEKYNNIIGSGNNKKRHNNNNNNRGKHRNDFDSDIVDVADIDNY